VYGSGSKEVAQAKKDLLKQTDMTADGKPTDAANKAKQSLAKECAPVLALLEDTALVKQLRTDKLFTAAYLQENHKVEASHIDALYRYGKAVYQGGFYAEAAEALGAYKQLGTDAELTFRCGSCFVLVSAAHPSYSTVCANSNLSDGV